MLKINVNAKFSAKITMITLVAFFCMSTLLYADYTGSVKTDSAELSFSQINGYDVVSLDDYFDIDEEGGKDKLLLHNSPNPFCSSTVIQYTLPQHIREATIEIYNIKGQLVKTLLTFPNRGLGTSTAVWNGKDDKGKEVGAGMYFIYMKTGENVHVKKIVKLSL